MARGHQKLQSQAKAQEKNAKMKKAQGHSVKDQKDAAAKALVFACVICRVRIKKNSFLIILPAIYWKKY